MSLTNAAAPLKATVAIVLVARLAAAAEIDAPRDRIDALVAPYLENDVVVGMSIGMHQAGKTATLGYGRLGADRDAAPDERTVYEIGSVSKVFTGVLLADAAVRGRLQLDQPAGELLPGRVKMPEGGERPITLKDLATHVSGLPRLPTNFAIRDPSNPYADYDVDDLYGYLNGSTVDRSPGEKFEYSNLGVGLLGHLLALDAKLDYETLLKRHIAEPLEMSDTTITLSQDQQARLAPPHLADGQEAGNWDIPALAGAGAIRSTTADMLKFVAATLEPPEGELGEAINLAWKRQQPPLAEGDFAMGLGWHIARDGQTRWHNGQTGGYHSAVFVNRKLGVGVVLLANTATPEVDALAEQLVRLLAGSDEKPRVFDDETIEVTPEIAARYVGKYQLAPGAVFTITAKGDRLFAQLTGQPTFRVYPRSETEWFYKVVEATLTFKLDDDGKCTSLELFQNGARMPANRVAER